MTDSRESGAGDQDDQPTRPNAVAYYRHSAQGCQEDSIAIQRDQVREWADNNDVDIIHEFTDPAQSEPATDSPP